MGIYKKEKRLHDFFKLFFANNIYTKKLNEKIQNDGDSSIYDNSCDGGYFSHVYIILN
jgi:hypothetical protein